MSSDSEEYYSEEESASSTISGRSSRSSRRSSASDGTSQSSNVIIADSDSDSEIEIIRRKKGGKGRRIAAVISESEEEDEDQRALSPRTRMSITGVRPQDMNEDSSELDYSDEEQPSANSSNVYQATADSGEQQKCASEDEEIYSANNSSVLPASADNSVIGSDRDETYDEGAELQKAGADREESNADTPRDENNADTPRDEYNADTQLVENKADTPRDEDNADTPRYSTQFVENIENTLHSTLCPIVEQSQEEKNESSGSDVVIINNREATIEISSSSDSDFNQSENASLSNIAKLNTNNGRPLAERSNNNLVQPTILAAIKKSPSQPVSRAFYVKEAQKLAEMRTQLIEAEKLFDKVAQKLPDKGAQIKNRIVGLRQDITMKAKYLTSIRVAEEVPSVKTSQPPIIVPRKPANEQLDWDDLSAAVNEIKPTYTGSQGMATFNTQRALTLDSLKELHGSLKGCPAENVLADDPAGLKVQLMDHQKHALAWMFWREQQRPRGGILADDMGLGKTLTMISLVLECKNRQGSSSNPQDESTDEEENAGKPRKSVGGWNSKGRKDSHNGGTLVVCPASLLRQWEAEVTSKLTRNRLTVCVHHGANRESKGKHLRTYDIVVTTYNIVGREQKTAGALYGIKWRRIILDEAHVVRNHKAQSSMAVTELRGKYRWALTGTPIQNKELDVFALLKFLRCSPFDDLATWKRWIDNKSAGGQERLNLLMKSIMLRRTKALMLLEGKLNNMPNKEIRLIEMSLDTEEMNVYQRVMTYSRTLFAQFLFQRAEKDTDANFINDAYKPTYNQIKDPNGAYYKMHEKFARMAGHNKEVKSHEILVLLLRLRQICCHPGLIDSMLEEESGTAIDHDESNECAPEIDLLAQLNKLNINDVSGETLEGDNNSPMGGDDMRFTKASQNVLKRGNPVFNFKRPSTKMLKVLEILKTTVLQNNDKAIIVSQWTSMLDILRDMLEKENLTTLSLNGKIPVKNRQDIVNEFNDARCAKRILLLSLTAGGVGLNLIGANHLILLDLHWNPQLEAQAQDRIYRVGQKKDVTIYKIVCMDTVEQRIKALQDRKLELANGVLTGGKVSTKLSIDDLKGLFGM